MSTGAPQAPLAPYAVPHTSPRGRLHPESPARFRSDFRRDCDRVLHSSAFRRLSYKTQVFVDSVGQNYRTRLTHSLEVAQIARSLARTLGLNEDLTETLALSHDLGHTCFGHAGEDALHECMIPFGGFDHNAQSLKIVTSLEHRYADFDGLNLCWETLEGLVKHKGPLCGPLAPEGCVVPPCVTAFNALFDLELHTFPGAEAQVAALSDDIAYNAHDLDDGLRARFVDIGKAEDVALVGPIFRSVRAEYTGLSRSRLIHEVIRRLIGLMIDDVTRESRARLDALSAKSPCAIRNHPAPVIAFSPRMRAAVDELGEFLFTNLYRHYRVNRMTSKARRVVRELFGCFLNEPRLLAPDWRARAGDPGDAVTARTACDYIAGMTDRFALDEHARLFDPFERT
ncbi:deoxyguanosinetriphosphate triphosphohydrolase [Phaeovibrio sulfidiphilus]|uniref:Deoxyguanosinetriphosphate triphosphohydrolase-like protein n=1 Tax=Phaeovibrio sulfidiphilus TaxID=1220600 RepID=A0A8J7CPX8_9PROT|nr:deoxyguanosinetriphosphate triphosphohydrolase [Phaeovibrio sulfidiphilus]MBE1237592.1 deoxyguanosinetriphosphate triphosphohydrolase [Phaeovibrio sulfidiphilus]